MSNGQEGFAFPPLRERGTIGKLSLRVKPASGLGGGQARASDKVAILTKKAGFVFAGLVMVT